MTGSRKSKENCALRYEEKGENNEKYENNTIRGKNDVLTQAYTRWIKDIATIENIMQPLSVALQSYQSYT